MTTNDLQAQLIKYLTDAHSIERQALVQMKAAPGIAGDPEIASAFQQHETETEEHMELAACDLLARVADRAGDGETATMARRIEPQERAMAARLEDLSDRAVDDSLRDLAPDELVEQLRKYLEVAHAIESQSIQLLSKGRELAGSGRLAEAYMADTILGDERAAADRVYSAFDEALDSSLEEQGVVAR